MTFEAVWVMLQILGPLSAMLVLWCFWEAYRLRRSSADIKAVQGSAGALILIGLLLLFYGGAAALTFYLGGLDALLAGVTFLVGALGLIALLRTLAQPFLYRRSLRKAARKGVPAPNPLAKFGKRLRKNFVISVAELPVRLFENADLSI